MNAVLRTARPEDRHTIFEILRGAFQLESKRDKEQNARRMAENDYGSFVLLEDQDQVVGVVHLGRDRLQVGRSVVLKGDVGHVAVRPELQGRGYGTKLMHEAVRFMGENGFHLTRLGGLMLFYHRFGYEPVPRRYINIAVAPMDSELKGVKWSDIRAIPKELADRVRRYHPAQDYLAVHALRKAFNEGRSACPVLGDPGTPPSEGPDPNGLAFVYEERGALRGYLRGALAIVHAGDEDPSYRLDDFAMDFDCPQACEALFKTFIWEAAKAAPTVISARLPYDERLFTAINAADIAFDVLEMHQAADGNMMQVVNLPALLEAVAPELSTRLAEAEVDLWQGSLRFVLPRQTGDLRITGCAVSAMDQRTPDVTVETDHATFIKWLFGINGFSEFAASFTDLTGRQRLLLSVLFPRLPCASGPWG